MYKDFEPVIGLEIHAQLKTASKIFSSDSTAFDSGDNENTSPISIGMPGVLPLLNIKAVELSIRMGLSLGCEIRKKSIFARKNYFYPDLPKGYQISQYDAPLCENGKLCIELKDQEKRIVRIKRAHMEEDAGKSTHFGTYTLINYNRSGIPLLEIVTEPDLRSPSEAAEFTKRIRQILKYLDVCDGNLEEGSLRCDCNVSVKRKNDLVLGTRVEIKNLNSFRFIEKAIEYEIERQIDLLERDGVIIQETRLWDSDKNRTFPMRGKEEAEDYRYFPDPDLLPLIVSQEWIQNIKMSIPELPEARKKRFIDEHKLAEDAAELLTSEKELADYYEKAALKSGNPKTTAYWVMMEVLYLTNKYKTPLKQIPFSSEKLAEVILLMDQGKISAKTGKQIITELWEQTSVNVLDWIDKKGLIQISDFAQLEGEVQKVLEKNHSQVEEYLSGKEKVFGFFMGQIMKSTQGKANPDLLREVLTKKIAEIKKVET